MLSTGDQFAVYINGKPYRREAGGCHGTGNCLLAVARPSITRPAAQPLNGRRFSWAIAVRVMTDRMKRSCWQCR